MIEAEINWLSQFHFFSIPVASRSWYVFAPMKSCTQPLEAQLKEKDEASSSSAANGLENRQQKAIPNTYYITYTTGYRLIHPRL